MDILWLIGRIALAFLFISAGWTHIRNHPGMVGLASSMNQPLPTTAGWPTGVALVLAGLGVVFGIWIDLALLVLFAFLILAAVLYHAWWEIEEDIGMAAIQQQMFFKNFAIAGGVLAVFALIWDTETSYTLTQNLLSN